MSIRPPCATPLSPPPHQCIWQFAFFLLWTVGSQLSYWELGWCSWSLTRLPCKIEVWTCTNLWLPRVGKKHRPRSTSILVELDTLLFDMALKANKFDVSIFRYHFRVQGHARWFPQRLEVNCTQETGINLDFPLPQTSYAIKKKNVRQRKVAEHQSEPLVCFGRPPLETDASECIKQPTCCLAYSLARCIHGNKINKDL